ncbi:hypothetical protein NM208_g14825 [Fusarium decemcellulare]|uniref:Uncharacterized protein n=1 Tax=Fusarium decemcellulare TaxID=57161 RepID=A0ACC1RIZ1_9HYPO|nr:hypothetical protein NM208_g14825 [Fusarium decemcellulare]
MCPFDRSLSQPTGGHPARSRTILHRFRSRSSSPDSKVYFSPASITTFPVALHPDESQVSQGAETARDAWLRLLPNSDPRPHSSGPFGNFFALCWPHGETSRVNLAAEIVETLWLYDDIIDDAPPSEAMQTHGQLRDSLKLDSTVAKSNLKTVVTGFFKEFGMRMSEVDAKGVPNVVNSLKDFLASHDNKKSGELPSIENFIESRVLDVGFWIMESYMLWTMGMQFSASEIEMCHEFRLSAGRVMALTNDLYSWNVERQNTVDPPWNVLPIIIDQYKLTERDAIIFTRGLIIQHEEETRRLGAEVLEYSDNSQKMQNYHHEDMATDRNAAEAVATRALRHTRFIQVEAKRPF